MPIKFILLLVRASLADGKIELNCLRKEIVIQLPDTKLTGKMDILLGNIQSEEIGTLSHSMMDKILKLKVTTPYKLLIVINYIFFISLIENHT